MRELKECTAEVFRRSEKRIKDRKRNRNRLLVLCLPLCLVVTALSVTLLPALMAAERRHDNAVEMDVGYGDGNDAETTLESLGISCAYTAVALQGAAHSEMVTDRAAIANLYDTIRSIFAHADGEGQGDVGDVAEESADLDQTESAEKREEYTILFSNKEGEQTVYHLVGNTLLHEGTNETVRLSDAQVAELFTVFGIPE